MNSRTFNTFPIAFRMGASQHGVEPMTSRMARIPTTSSTASSRRAGPSGFKACAAYGGETLDLPKADRWCVFGTPALRAAPPSVEGPDGMNEDLPRRLSGRDRQWAALSPPATTGRGVAMFLDWRLKKHCSRCKQYRPVEGGRQNPGKPFVCGVQARRRRRTGGEGGRRTGRAAAASTPKCTPRDPDENWISSPAIRRRWRRTRHYRDLALMTTSGMIISGTRHAAAAAGPTWARRWLDLGAQVGARAMTAATRPVSRRCTRRSCAASSAGAEARKAERELEEAKWRHKQHSAGLAHLADDQRGSLLSPPGRNVWESGGLSPAGFAPRPVFRPRRCAERDRWRQ